MSLEEMQKVVFCCAFSLGVVSWFWNRRGGHELKGEGLLVDYHATASPSPGMCCSLGGASKLFFEMEKRRLALGHVQFALLLDGGERTGIPGY